MATDRSDQELIEQIRHDRDQRAMAALYDRYSRPVYSLAFHMLRDPRGAEDVVQDVFLGFWQRPFTYIESRGAFGPWILRVTRNRAIDVIRKRSRERSPGSDEAAALFEERIVDPDPEPGEQVWTQAVAHQVRAAMQQLNDAQRQVIELAYFTGMTQSEMADHLGIPLGTIKTRVRTALRRLSDIMSDAEAWTDAG
ncbi:MAG TPA: sigma-70 family RNA polymerase sigma factor [Nitrolancea sp.]|nr:sigma-70 family RNA polymerase sigma factor [Nitrolancea sp.]